MENLDELKAYLINSHRELSNRLRVGDVAHDTRVAIQAQLATLNRIMSISGIIPPEPQPAHGAHLTLREIQLTLPWTVKYSCDYRANPQSHKDFTHAILHAQKALGKLAAAADDMDHARDAATDMDSMSKLGDYMADLVLCALRMANTVPSTSIDIHGRLLARIADKNNLKLVTTGGTGYVGSHYWAADPES